MKRALFVTIFVFLGLYVFAQNAVIEEAVGTVEIKNSNENAFKKANNGDKIFQDTVISTSFKSFAIVKIGSTTLTIRPLTLLTLTEIQHLAETETLNVNLQTGRIRVDVKPPAGLKAATTVRGPTSTASVRGTSFEFDTSNLYVSEGSVNFGGSKGQHILVARGGSSRTDHSGGVTNPRDERISNLMPPAPVGTGATDTATTGSVPAGAHFGIELKFL
ncbi:MAG: FecR family protein [Treponema sp.]|jgi:hypothetical protein|nr:FecR family protein [Treponema sp.]